MLLEAMTGNRPYLPAAPSGLLTIALLLPR
jgi:hypothetical protein